MPLFNFRRAGPPSASSAASATQTDSVEVIRKRAKHRLIGASVLVLAGVIGFPLLFDTQPRPISVDIPIEIPGKNAVKPLVLPAKTEAGKPVAASAPASDKIAATSSIASKEEILPEKKAAAPVVPAPAATKKEAAPVPRAEARAEPKAAAEDGARARALLNAQTASAAKASSSSSGDGRLVVQVGSFSDATKAREARLKLEKAGLKSYSKVSETKDGKRFRVRVGPFATKAEAEKAASQIRALALPTAILSLQRDQQR
jgi:DedD protein